MRDEAGDRSPKQGAPAEAAPRGQSEFDRDGQLRRVGFWRDLNCAAAGPGRILGIDDNDVRIVEPECLGTAGLGAFAHCSRSPIRN